MGAHREEDAGFVVTALFCEVIEEEIGDHIPGEDADEALQKHKPHGFFLEDRFGLCPGELKLSHFFHIGKFGFGSTTRHFLDPKINHDGEQDAQSACDEEDVAPTN